MKNITNGIVTEIEQKEINATLEERRFHSRLGVFNATNGIRPNELSVIVGPAGNGKSTLCKTISVECAIGGRKCFHLLSEEKTFTYKNIISKTFEKMTGGKNLNSYLEKLYFESMLDWSEDERAYEYFFDHLEDVINDLVPDMVIFDNFSTSFLGELNINLQGRMIARLRKMAASYEIAIVVVFHTAKGTNIYKKILDGEDVRGNASSTNAGAYNYIVSTYFRVNPPKAIVNIDKARYHPNANKKYYEMLYDKELGIYIKDMRREYEEVKKIVDEANGKKEKTNGQSKSYKRQDF